MRLEPLIAIDGVRIFEGCRSCEDIFERFAALGSEEEPAIDAEALKTALQARESERATSTPLGVAFPHAMLPGLERTHVYVALIRPAISFAEGDDVATDLAFCMLGSAERPWEHVQLLARLARIVQGAGALERLRSASSPDELFERLVQEDRVHG